MHVFFPIEDAGAERATGPLVPYRCGIPCAHELRGELVLRDGVWTERAAQRRICISSPGDSPIFRA